MFGALKCCRTAAASRHFLGKSQPHLAWESVFGDLECDKYTPQLPCFLARRAMLLGTLPSALGPMSCLPGTH